MSEEHSRQFLQVLERIAVALERMAEPQPPHWSGDAVGIESELPEVPHTPAPVAPHPQQDFDGDGEIGEFLTARGITVRSIKEARESDEHLDRIATYLGKHWSSVSKLYKTIKRNLNDGAAFSIHVKSDTQTDISNMCQFAKNLHDIAFLTQYRYLKSPQFIIHGAPSRAPQCINFLTGGWLERYIGGQAVATVMRHRPGLRVSSLGGIQIALPNGDQFELDLLVCVEGGEIFWFEAKTGNYQQYVDKYARMSKVLKLDQKHTFLILTEIQRNTASTISDMHKITVANIEDFDAVLSERLTQTQPHRDGPTQAL